MASNPNSSNNFCQILCCECGTPIQPNPANTCVNCLRTRIDITDGIQKEVILVFCKQCGRYFKPPWISAEQESRELLSLCLQKIKGLKKVKLIDATFVWTESHSMRYKIKVTVQKEVLNGVILQQGFIAEFILQNQQCPDCAKSWTEDPWHAIVQIRQRVDHKRTFLFLEQLLLKHHFHDQIAKIKEYADGLDLFLPDRNACQHLIDFLQTVIPIRSKFSKKLISQDFTNNTIEQKYTWAVEIPPLCKDDLIYLPKEVYSTKGGGIGPLVICYQISSYLRFLDPFTLDHFELNATQFWRNPFSSLLSIGELVPFIIMDISRPLKTFQHYGLSEVVVCRDADIGKNEMQYTLFTHLGHVLHVGDTCLGYDLERHNFNFNILALKTKSKSKKFKYQEVPPIILIKKDYGERHKRKKFRKWQIRRLVKDQDINMKDNKEKEENDIEGFMENIEEDSELRNKIQLYQRPIPAINEEQYDEQENIWNSIIPDSLPILPPEQVWIQPSTIDQSINEMKINS